MNRTAIHTLLPTLLFSGVLLMAGCSGHEDIAPSEEQVPIAFDMEEGDEAAAVRAATRAGRTGGMTQTTLKQTSFGVFAYYTQDVPWSSFDTSVLPAPNFMYNQRVDYSNTQGQWSYTPVKYWPNENEKADTQGATGEHSHSYLSFFAYAPYVALTQAADPTSAATPTEDDALAAADRRGIVAISGHAATGHPLLTYRLHETDATQQVDLLWGLRGRETYHLANGDDDTQAPLPDDLANTDLTKMAVGEHVSFRFRHALAAVDVYVQRVYDEPTPKDKTPLTDQTRIYVSSFSLRCIDAPWQADLDLTNGQWIWRTEDLQTTDVLTPMARIADALRGTTAANASLAEVQTIELNRFDAKEGVTETPHRLLAEAYPYTALVIPTGRGTGLRVQPSITYNFVTRDDNLATGLPDATGTHRYARIQNTATASAPVSVGTYDKDDGTYTLKAGKTYRLFAYIGTEHVSFRLVGVEEWDFPLRFTLEDVEEYQKETDDWQRRGLSED